MSLKRRLDKLENLRSYDDDIMADKERSDIIEYIVNEYISDSKTMEELERESIGNPIMKEELERLMGHKMPDYLYNKYFRDEVKDEY